MGRLEGKACVITGAGGGIGREAAQVFTNEGAKVCVADVDLEAAEETVALCSGEAFALRGDLADLLHRVEGGRVVDEPRARGAVRPAGRAGERALSRSGRDAAPAADLRRRPC